MITKLNLPGLVNNETTILGAGALFTTGKTFYVDSVRGSNGNSGSDPDFPFATIAQAQSAATASMGDVVIIKPGYTETRTSALTLSKAGVSYYGLGNGSLKPTITGNGTIDAVDITAANIVFDGFHFAAPETDAQTAAINLAAGSDGAIVRNITGVGSQTAKNVVDMITIVAAANDVTIENVSFYNATVAVNSFLNIEGAVSNLTVKNFHSLGEVVAGGIIDGGAVTNLRLEDSTILVTGTSKSAIVLDSNPTGVAIRVYARGTNTTLASNVNYGNALSLFECRTAEDLAVQGAIIPAADTD